MLWAPAIGTRKRTCSSFRAPNVASLQVFGFYFVVVKDMLVPESRLIRAARWSNVRPVADEHNHVLRTGTVVVQTRDVARRIGPQGRVGIFFKIFREFAIALPKIALREAELLHSRHSPVPGSAVFIKNNRLHVG